MYADYYVSNALDDLARECYAISKDHGFHEENDGIPDDHRLNTSLRLALIVTEVAEESGKTVQAWQSFLRAMKHKWITPAELGYTSMTYAYLKSCHLCGIMKNDKNTEADNCRGLVKVTLR